MSPHNSLVYSTCRPLFHSWKERLQQNDKLKTSEIEEICKFLETAGEQRNEFDYTSLNFKNIIADVAGFVSNLAHVHENDEFLLVLREVFHALVHNGNFDVVRTVNVADMLVAKDVALKSLLCELVLQSVAENPQSAIRNAPKLCRLITNLLSTCERSFSDAFFEQISHFPKSKLRHLEFLVNLFAESETVFSSALFQKTRCHLISALATLNPKRCLRCLMHYEEQLLLDVEFNYAAFHLIKDLQLAVNNYSTVMAYCSPYIGQCRSNLYGFANVSDLSTQSEYMRIRLFEHNPIYFWIEFASRVCLQNANAAASLDRAVQELDFPKRARDMYTSAFNAAEFETDTAACLCATYWLKLKRELVDTTSTGVFISMNGVSIPFLEKSAPILELSAVFEKWLFNKHCSASFAALFDAWVLLAQVFWRAVGPARFTKWLCHSLKRAGVDSDGEPFLNWILLHALADSATRTGLDSSAQVEWEALIGANSSIPRSLRSSCNSSKIAQMMCVEKEAFSSAQDTLAVLAVANFKYFCNGALQDSAKYESLVKRLYVNSVVPVLPQVNRILDLFPRISDDSFSAVLWNSDVKVEYGSIEAFQNVPESEMSFQLAESFAAGLEGKAEMLLAKQSFRQLRHSKLLRDAAAADCDTVDEDLKNISDYLFDEISFSMDEALAAEEPHLLLSKLAEEKSAEAPKDDKYGAYLDDLDRDLDAALAMFGTTFDSSIQFRKQRLEKCIAQH